MSESIRRMIDCSYTAQDVHRSAVLVQRHIRENEGPYENSVLVNMLMLRCVALTANGSLREHDIRAMAKDAMTTFHTNPPGQRTEA